MKNLSFLLLLIVPLWLNAQIPAYYNDVNLTLTGTALKNELATKITNTHTTLLTYTQVWYASQVTDLDPNDATQTNVILIYGYSDTDGNYVTDRTRDKNANGGTAGTDWNREHTYAKSLGTPNLGTSGPGADAHHLRPADVTFNGQRSSKKFAAGIGNAGDSNGGWYPGDEWKGDIARMMMYMYARYGNQCLPTGIGIGSAANTPDDMIDLFLQWNVDDPVSQIEKNRNAYHANAANAYAQGNRNPFIDNPAFATQIWGGPQAEDLFGGGGGGTDTSAPSIPTNLASVNTTQTSTDLTWSASSDNVAVTGYDVYKDGVLLASTTGTSYNVTALLAATSYTFTVTAKDAAGNVSASSNVANVTTLSGGSGTGNEIFISEYIEGSSYNKAIEIANFTGSTVDLSVYSLKRNTNGGTSWGAALNLSGQLTDGDVFVVANTSATAAILNVADLSSGAEAMTFNGNDPVGLFKNNVLIDIVGNFNGGSANFAADITLRRTATITNPSVTYNTVEWVSFAKDTFDGLGTHTTTGGGTQDTQAPTAPTALTASNIAETTLSLNWNAATDNVGVTAYEVFKNGVLLATVTSTSYNVTGLSASTSYTFTVTAKDAAGNISANSNTASVTTIDNTAPVAPASLVSANTTQTGTDLTWSASSDNVAVTGYDVYKDGVLLASTTSASYSVTALLAATSYTFTVTAKDAAGNVSASSNVANVTTLSGGGSGTGNEIFISEYIEGSSYNKAIEIANFTGNTVDLSVYSLKRNTNGGTSWGAALNLSGQLINGDVFVVANTSATTAILNVADLSSGAEAMTFNGNDPVGLFKNNVLIDIVGNFNGGSANFAADITLRRTATITNPSTAYNTADWASFAKDTFDGLGTHTTSTVGGGSGTTTNILLAHSFETGWDGWIDGGTDCYRINSSKSFDGSYSIRIRDNSGTQSAMTSSAYDVSAYANLEVKFNFYSYSMETNEDFWLQYFDGSAWTTVKAFVSGTDFSNNRFTAATVNIASSTYNFPVNAQFRFQCDASSNADEIYIDNVTVTATSGAALKSGSTTISLNKLNDFENRLIEIDGLELFPNPAVSSTTLRAELDIEDNNVDVQVNILNLQGKLVKTFKYNSIKTEFFEQNINLSGLKSGLYFINITSTKGMSETKKLIVK